LDVIRTEGEEWSDFKKRDFEKEPWPRLSGPTCGSTSLAKAKEKVEGDLFLGERARKEAEAYVSFELCKLNENLDLFVAKCEPGMEDCEHYYALLNREKKIIQYGFKSASVRHLVRILSNEIILLDLDTIHQIAPNGKTIHRYHGLFEVFEAPECQFPTS
ncbi:MAG: hypothetical protein GY847_08285, partial [Proteobacteria bacterium]|nr:hypothetical protein [Pseudomonadota bacterium]